jgi:hypothetical protein
MESIASKPGDHKLKMNEFQHHKLWPRAIELCAGQEAIDAFCDRTTFEKCDVHVRTPSDSPAAASRDTGGEFSYWYLALCTTILNIGRIDCE